MQNDWQARFTAEAMARVDRYIAEHEGLTRQGVQQPGQGATNRVIFARQGEKLVVFKVFCDKERKQRECFALRHWGPTGLVPELLADADDRMILISHVPGSWLMQLRESQGQQAWRNASKDTGRAIATLTKVALCPADRQAFESRFYGKLGPLEAYLTRVLQFGRSIHERDKDFSGSFWRESLDFMESQLPGILAQPRVLYHQDVGNLHVRDGRFAGFFDLEMCVVGCTAMQLASAMGMIECGNLAWDSFREGWEEATGKPLTPGDAAAAFAARQFLGWREISRYMSYDGTPGTGFEWAEPADPAVYRRCFETAGRLLDISVF